MGQQTETDLQLGLALMEQVPDLDLSHRSLVSDDSKQRRGMEQKRTLTSMGRQSVTVSHWALVCRSSLQNVDPGHTLLVLDDSQQ